MLRIDAPLIIRTKSTYVPKDQRIGDITLHIEEELSTEGLKIVEEALIKLDGVEKVLLHPSHPHLLVIHYDTFKISSRLILKTIENQNLFPFGLPAEINPQLHARMVGL
ncbi:MAG: hypothetical protein HQL52_06265 [Magnetococcales bacterium]|nr:hypothetical protein [Magnetococcales bacterium]